MTGYETLKKFNYNYIVRLNKRAVELSRLWGVWHGGHKVWKKKSIQEIVDTIHFGAEYRELAERICAKAIKIFVRTPQTIYQPFWNCNHRTMMLLTYEILEEFYPDIEPDVSEWKSMGKKIDKLDVHGIEQWLTHAHDLNASFQAGLRSNLRSLSSKRLSNSSSVIKGKYTSADINTLLQSGWQPYGKAITIQEIEKWKCSYGADWEVKAVPSSRYTGKFDMYIKRK